MFKFAIAVPEHRNTNEAGEIKIYPSIPIYTHPLPSPRLNTTQSSVQSGKLCYKITSPNRTPTYDFSRHMPSSQMTRVSGVLILNSVPKIQISSQCKNPSNHHPNVNLEAKSTYPRINLIQLMRGRRSLQILLHILPPCILLTHHPKLGTLFLGAAILSLTFVRLHFSIML
jgi:hypothetical protein